ncbi:MAG: bifunctional phosphopantothenoylcysteine decarboxylase/phosphopantothenate--cysteine ligase CoaBC [Proteobacteria bacterium]|nr:bifunctional phosphopantothenoylcysteine decarboxylase/phosphopantothenate--cysteine ligase CoaBC [Pseudomonadota bacterium]
MSQPLQGERILLGVCGGIAAYKAAELVRRLREAGAQVQVVMTAAAGHFVGAATFQALSGRPVRDSLWDANAEAAMGHIELARWATRVVVAPASADAIARIAHGHADDLLATLCLVATAPLAIVPAMNHRMWLHPATQANVATLKSRGALAIGPDVGAQACGEFGPGRMCEPDAIVAALVAAHAVAGGDPLAGQRVLVSAGPTYEDLDPVRYLGNRSSGKMGFAIAAAAAELGAQVTLVAGPVHLPTPAGVHRIDVRSARQMHAAVLGALPQDIYIGAAAVADFMPARVAEHKIKKPTVSSDSGLTVELVRTPDILAEVAAHPQRPLRVVGFAAETAALADSARDKLRRKRVDAIAANRVGVTGSGFDADDNALDVYWRQTDGSETMAALGPTSKAVLARELLQLLLDRVPAAPTQDTP